jgi:hypothetical protein
MNFQDLYKKIADIDRTQVTESAIEECGAVPTSMPSTPKQPMSMTVNLNAQGEEDISSLMRLLTKVNPDMMPKGADVPMPTVGPELTIGGPGPKMSSPSDDIKGDMMKLLPLDKEADEKKEKEEGFQDATTEPDPEYKDTDYMVNKISGGLGKKQGTYPKVAGGDNPMQKTEGEDLLARIKEELQAKLAEVKGVK